MLVGGPVYFQGMAHVRCSIPLITLCPSQTNDRGHPFSVEGWCHTEFLSKCFSQLVQLHCVVSDLLPIGGGKYEICSFLLLNVVACIFCGGQQALQHRGNWLSCVPTPKLPDNHRFFWRSWLRQLSCWWQHLASESSYKSSVAHEVPAIGK